MRSKDGNMCVLWLNEQLVEAPGVAPDPLRTILEDGGHAAICNRFSRSPPFCDGAGDEEVTELYYVLAEHLLHIKLLCLGRVGYAVVGLSYEFSL